MPDASIFGDPNGAYAKVIADSISPRQHRLTTMEIQFWRPVLAEFNTHRKFSRNSASSRAIPVAKQIERILAHPAGPLVYPQEQRGMQGGESLEGSDLIEAKSAWVDARMDAIHHAEVLIGLGVHKSVVNRLLEPFMWHKVIVSSTEWWNFFAQRCSPLAQPEIRVVAEHMRAALVASDPTFVDYGEWHLPYVGDDRDVLGSLAPISVSKIPIALAQISAARSARVSYLTHDGVRDVAKDLDLYAKLVGADPEHWSPLEHPATPTPNVLEVPGNFDGWRQLRHHSMAKAS